MNDTTAIDTISRQTPPIVIPRAEHPISRAAISSHALKVLYRLKDAGYQAFLVGGSVRDLLLGGVPKDFDVATNALPEEMRRLFRNCRLIGRRFRLAHVHYGDEIIEVATFRAAQAPDELDDEDHREIDDMRVTDQSGRLLRDNIYGSIDDDVWRRDFTANALYYNIDDFSIWDYVGGVADVRDKVLRLIGDPETRFREDPVRLLRAIRFAGKLGFTVHPDTRAPMAKLAPLLAGVPAARLFDECTKMFLSGHAVNTFRLLQEFDLLQHLLPGLAAHLQDYPESPARQLLDLGLRGTDERVAAGKPVSPTFLFAVLLYGPIAAAADEHIADGASEIQALAVACDEVIGEQMRRVAVPKRFTLPLRELLALQPRFRRRDGRKALALLNHPRFRGAYDLLLLRASAGLEPQELADWWTEIQELPGEQRIERAEAAAVAVGADGGESVGDAPRRRRRRRRRGPAPTPV